MMPRAGEGYHRVSIELADVYGNKSSVRFYLQQRASSTEQSCERLFYANQKNLVEQSGISFLLDESALYASTCLTVSSRSDDSGFSNRYTAGRADIPVHHYFDLKLKPNKLVPFALRSKMAMIHSEKGRDEGTAATTAPEGWYKASVRALGEYRLVADTTAPSVRPVMAVKGTLSKAKSIAFRVTDNLTSVKSFRAELDGKWILFEQHGSTWTYVFDEHCPKGVHRLVVTAKDENGNEAMASFTFTR
jgi:hypothetical protein